MVVSIGSEFGKAFCEHFGLKPEVVGNITVNADVDEILHARPTIFLNAEDLEAIALKMQRKEQHEHAISRP